MTFLGFLLLVPELGKSCWYLEIDNSIPLMGSILFRLGYRQLKQAPLLKKDNGALLLTGWSSNFYEAAFGITQ